MKCWFMYAAISPSSKDSCAITWHQWHAAYPILRKMGLSSSLARLSASGPQGYQSTGLSLCCSRYGELDCASRFGMLFKCVDLLHIAVVHHPLQSMEIGFNVLGIRRARDHDH